MRSNFVQELHNSFLLADLDLAVSQKLQSGDFYIGIEDPELCEQVMFLLAKSFALAAISGGHLLPEILQRFSKGEKVPRDEVIIARGYLELFFNFFVDKHPRSSGLAQLQKRL